MIFQTRKKMLKRAQAFGLLFVVSACSSPVVVENGTSVSEWDFDHKVQFYKTKFDDNHYQVEVVSNGKSNFGRLSAFLLRRSYLICGGYGYKLTLIKGVESFDHYRASPHLIMANLTAELECPTT